jgi:ATP phosphoribosyltransferase
MSQVKPKSVPKLKLGLPKGSLEEATFRLMEKAGVKVYSRSRSYYPVVSDPDLDVVLYRPQEMSRYVEDGVIDAAITGYDWMVENGTKRVQTMATLTYSKQTRQPIRWVLAVHEDSPFKSVKDLNGKKIATELVNVTKNYLKEKGVKAEVEFSWGATEVKPPLLADAIVEATETGSSLRANRLRIIDTLMESRTVLIANLTSIKDKWKRSKIENLALLLQGAILAEEKVGLKMNVSKQNLKKVLSILPALKKPTISNLSDDGWYDVDTIIDETDVIRLIPDLKRAGAEGIIEYPLNKVIY